jgi:peptide/nickel transport system permease protein
VAVYLLRRVLLMLPTFAGIAVLIWLVMWLAPGKPTASGGGQDMGSDPAALDPNRDESERIFREQFALNRPPLLNTWPWLTKEDVRTTVTRVHEGVQVHGIATYRRERERLVDWGRYAIPGLVDLLDETSGDLQTSVASWLPHNAHQFRALYAAGHKPTPEEEARDKHVTQENELLKELHKRWDPKAAPDARVPVVQAWQEWFEERTGEWDLGALEKTGRFFSDTQFGHYVGNLARLDLGLSSRYRKPVGELIGDRLKYSLTLAVPSFLLAWVLAVLLGVVSAVNHRKPLDHGIGIGLFILYSIPIFAAGTLLQRFLAREWGWFPVSDFESGSAKLATMTTWEHFKDILWHVTLPIVVYTYGSLAYISRQARSGMLEVLKSDFVRTARAKGLPERQVVWRHAVRNGMMPIVTLLGTALPILIGGSVPIEYIFNIDGFGRLLLESIFQKDYNVVMGVELIVALLTLVGLLLTDVIYAAMDPRIKYS